MMGPITPDSRNVLWEYLGRRFINLDYTEADKFCQTSKEFMSSLLPKGEIYVSLLPPEARTLIGRVGSETEPAKNMLERLGFEYKNQCDPFDGGPYLEAQTSRIPLVASTRQSTLGQPAREHSQFGIVSVESDTGFRAVRCHYADEGATISIPAEAAAAIGAHVGDTVGVTPLSAAAAADDSSNAAIAGAIHPERAAG
jgi:arginine N-succinyltransferase